MSVKFHIRDDGTVGDCDSIMDKCPYGEHFADKKDAIHRSEEIFKDQSASMNSMSKTNTIMIDGIKSKIKNIDDELIMMKGHLDDVKSRRRRIYLDSEKDVNDNLRRLMDKTIKDRRLFKSTADDAIMVANGRDDKINPLMKDLEGVAHSGRIPISMYSDRSNLKSLRPVESKTVMRPSKVTGIRLKDTIGKYVIAESTVKSVDGKTRKITTRLDPKRLAHNLGLAIDRRKLIAKDIEAAGRMDNLKDIGDTITRSMSNDGQKNRLKERLYSTPALRKAFDDDVRLASEESSMEHRMIRSFNDKNRFEVAMKALESSGDVEDGIRSIMKNRNDRLFRSDGVEFGPEGKVPDVHEWCVENGIV